MSSTTKHKPKDFKAYKSRLPHPQRGLKIVSIGWYARRGHRLVSEDIDEERARLRTAQGLAVPLVFLASIAITSWSTEAATLWWLLLLVTDPAVGWVWRRAPSFVVG